MRTLMVAAMAAAGVALGGCGDLLAGGGSSRPPKEITEACTTIGQFPQYVQTSEWVKPLATSHHRNVRWERADPGFVMRTERDNPLSGTTESIAVWFVPVEGDATRAPFCKSFYEPVQYSANGIEYPGMALKIGIWQTQVVAMRKAGTQPEGQSPRLVVE